MTPCILVLNPLPLVLYLGYLHARQVQDGPLHAGIVLSVEFVSAGGWEFWFGLSFKSKATQSQYSEEGDV